MFKITGLTGLGGEFLIEQWLHPITPDQRRNQGDDDPDDKGDDAAFLAALVRS